MDNIVKGAVNRLGINLLPYQEEVLTRYRSGKSGLVMAPTGTGKTLSIALPFFCQLSASQAGGPPVVRGSSGRCHSSRRQPGATPSPGCRLLWVTPLRALARDTRDSLEELARAVGLDELEVGIRTGDTSSAARAKMRDRLPDVLVTTPESLHVLLSYPEGSRRFGAVQLIVADEWHELMGTKRGTQLELALAHLRNIVPATRVWGMSATFANPAEALRQLLGEGEEGEIVSYEVPKRISTSLLLPPHIERFPWVGHIGTVLAKDVAAVIEKHGTTLIFTTTRSQAELWYRALLEANPDLAGLIAVHHGSLDPAVRSWIEDSIQSRALRAVVCTSSLDLGVDFAPVDAVVQVGGPKSIARFLQRAGRSGHGPGRESIAYLVPTHALELLDFAALHAALRNKTVEPRPLLNRPLDVLVQWILTLAGGDGVHPDELLTEVRRTTSYAGLTDAEWEWCLAFVAQGGRSLKAYDEYHKVVYEDGRLRLRDHQKLLRHRLSIGTITSDPMLNVKYVRGGRVGSVEEAFASRLRPGETFMLGGKSLEFVQLRELTVYVKKSTRKASVVPRWMGGRISLSSAYAAELRAEIERAAGGDPELQPIEGLLDLQRRWSALPKAGETLLEEIKSRDGYHLFVYPVAGRAVHEGLAIVLAHRLTGRAPRTVSLAMNDYGFEILSDEPLPPFSEIWDALTNCESLGEDIIEALRASEMAKRRFHEIARVSCLTFSGSPWKRKSEKYLIASSQLLFDVFSKYEPESLLLQQSYEEVRSTQLEFERLRNCMQRIGGSRPLRTAPPRFTPFSFPLVVDRLREQLSSESLERRVKKLQASLEAAADKETARMSRTRGRKRS